jgi:hypothetical protein
VTEGELPFTVRELQDAVELRLTIAEPGEIGALQAHVLGHADKVTIVVGRKVRVVSIAGTSGARAARTVALTLADLALEEATPVPMTHAGAPAAREAAPSGGGVDLLSRRAPSRRAGTMIAILPSIGTAGWGGGVGLGAPIGGGWRAATELGYLRGDTVEVSGETVALRGVPLRAAIARRMGLLELRLGGAVLAYQVSGGTGHGGLVAGGSTAAIMYLPLAGGLSFVVGVGADVFVNQIEFELRGSPAVETPRIAAWTSIGLAWEWSP